MEGVGVVVVVCSIGHRRQRKKIPDKKILVFPNWLSNIGTYERGLLITKLTFRAGNGRGMLVGEKAPVESRWSV